jgi:phage terminase large subunit-like protein
MSRRSAAASAAAAGRSAVLAATLLLLVPLTAVAAPPGRSRKLTPGTLEHFAEFCRRFIVLDNGKPFQLEAFQRLILAGFFAGVTEVLVLLPKKNGKTTLLAALALYHLIYTPDAACYIAASAKDQARIMYDQACGFVERKDPETGKLLPQAEALQQRVLLRKGFREIRSRIDGGSIRVVSGDKDTVDGVIVTLGLVDELHRHKDGGQLYGVLADGVGPRDGQIFTISTAGETMKSTLGRIRAKALQLPRVKRKGKYTFVRSPNGKFEMHEFSLDPKDDREDLRLVKQANPLSNNTIEKLRARKESPTMTPTRWARFGCGVWVQGEDAAYSSISWARCARPGLKLAPTAAIYLGLDIGWRWDTTAIVPVEPWDREELRIDGRPHWRWRRVRIGKPTILVPPRDGSSLSHEDVIKSVLWYRDAGYEILGVVFDRNAEGEKVAQELENVHGIDVIEHSQDPAPMADAAMGFGTAMGEGLVEHPDDDEYTAHILAAKAKSTTGEKWRIVAPEQHRGQRKQGQQDGDDIEYIDAAIATVMPHRVAIAPRPASPEAGARPRRRPPARSRAARRDTPRPSCSRCATSSTRAPTRTSLAARSSCSAPTATRSAASSSATTRRARDSRHPHARADTGQALGGEMLIPHDRDARRAGVRRGRCRRELHLHHRRRRGHLERQRRPYQYTPEGFNSGLPSTRGRSPTGSAARHLPAALRAARSG